MKTNSSRPLRTTVRQLRESRGLTQFQLAAQAGLSIQTVSLAERAGILTDRTAQAIAAVLAVQPSELRL